MRIAKLLLMGVVMVSAALADNFSFTGNFVYDDDVQLFNFSVSTRSTVTLRSWSYAGGTNAAGQIIASGGFDPILGLFDANGALLGQNDDGGCPAVAADVNTGRCYDTLFSVEVEAGNYIASISQWYNFANGPNLADGFWETGNHWFRDGFVDRPGNQRDDHWAFDILSVESATLSDAAAPVPEPAAIVLLGTTLLLVGGGLRRRMSHPE